LYLLAFICTQEWLFSLPNPKQVRDWAKGMGYRVKNDRIDGRLLAHFGHQCRPKAQWPVPEVIEQLDSLLQRQDDVEKMLRQERNRQHALSYRPQAATAAVGSIERIIACLEEEEQQILDAQESSSGSSVWKRPTISKMGNSRMRARLYLAALGGVRAKDSPLCHFYQRLVGRGKSTKLALVASSRKITVWSWAVFQQGVDFDCSRFATISN